MVRILFLLFFCFYANASQISGSSSSGTIAGSVGTVDNACVRADGTGGSTLQGTGVLCSIEDTGRVSALDFFANNSIVYGGGGATIGANHRFNMNLVGDNTKGLFEFTDQAGTLGITFYSALLRLINTSADLPAFIIKGASGQSADLLVAKDSSNNTLFEVSSGGALTSVGNIQVTGVTGAQMTVSDSNTDPGFDLYGNLTTPSGAVNTGGIRGRSTIPSSLAFFTSSDGTANATATRGILIETGNKTAGTGNSGGITLTAGTSAGGTRGVVGLVGSSVNVSNLLKTPVTVTTGGTTGDRTIDKISGTVNFAASATSITVTNNTVTTSSIVFAVVRTNDTTATIKNVVPGSGSFVITLTAAATAETSVGFLVLNGF